MKIDRGCEKDSPIPDKWQMGRFKFQRCPLKSIDPSIYEYIRAYNRFEAGFLPNAGGWLEQPAKFNDVIDIIGQELALIAKEKQEELEKKAKQR